MFQFVGYFSLRMDSNHKLFTTSYLFYSQQFLIYQSYLFVQSLNFFVEQFDSVFYQKHYFIFIF